MSQNGPNRGVAGTIERDAEGGFIRGYGSLSGPGYDASNDRCTQGSSGGPARTAGRVQPADE